MRRPMVYDPLPMFPRSNPLSELGNPSQEPVSGRCFYRGNPGNCRRGRAVRVVFFYRPPSFHQKRGCFFSEVVLKDLCSSSRIIATLLLSQQQRSLCSGSSPHWQREIDHIHCLHRRKDHRKRSIEEEPAGRRAVLMQVGAFVAHGPCRIRRVCSKLRRRGYREVGCVCEPGDG